MDEKINQLTDEELNEICGGIGVEDVKKWLTELRRFINAGDEVKFSEIYKKAGWLLPPNTDALVKALFLQKFGHPLE